MWSMLVSQQCWTWISWLSMGRWDTNKLMNLYKTCGIFGLVIMELNGLILGSIVSDELGTLNEKRKTRNNTMKSKVK